MIFQQKSHRLSQKNDKFGLMRPCEQALGSALAKTSHVRLHKKQKKLIKS